MLLDFYLRIYYFTILELNSFKVFHIVIIDVSSINTHVKITSLLCINWELKNQNERRGSFIHKRVTMNTTDKW